MNRARYVAFLLLPLAVLFQMVAGRSAAMARGHSRPSSSSVASLSSTDTAAAPQTGPTPTTASAEESTTPAQGEDLPLWSDFYEYRLYHPIADLMLAAIWMFLPILIVQHVLLSLSNRKDFGKLEAALRTHNADRDLDKLAHCCNLHRRAAGAPVIAAIIMQANVAHPTGLIKIERLRHAWLSVARIELSKWTGPLKYLQCLAWISLTVPAVCILSDLAWSLDVMKSAEGASGFELLWSRREDFTMLWWGLFIFVSSLACERVIRSRTNRLELRINQLSVDFIFGLLARANRQPALRYHPGMWMAEVRDSGQRSGAPARAQR